MRHGESLANREGILLSDPALGVPGYGLTSEGREQVSCSIRAAARLFAQPTALLIVSSDFLRAKETAQIARAELRCSREIEFTELLRERSFGPYSSLKVSEYKVIADGPQGKELLLAAGVETPSAMRDRGIVVLQRLEACYQGQEVLLVGHGDPLQVLRVVFLGMPPESFREIPYMRNAEILKI